MPFSARCLVSAPPRSRRVLGRHLGGTKNSTRARSSLRKPGSPRGPSTRRGRPGRPWGRTWA
eukprot:9783851-Alexandrium_andersonii.AAC.1